MGLQTGQRQGDVCSVVRRRRRRHPRRPKTLPLFHLARLSEACSKRNARLARKVWVRFACLLPL